MLQVGHRTSLDGNVTTLNWVSSRPKTRVEEALGYGPGRLSQGYWIALLVERLTENDFQFAGTTLQSDGRWGLPATSTTADKLRPRVHNVMINEYGLEGYRTMQRAALSRITIIGSERIMKVVPFISSNENESPARQYPMGGGALQWKLTNKRIFFIAAFVDANAVAKTPGFSVQIDHAPYLTLLENRQKLVRYLEMAQS